MTDVIDVAAVEDNRMFADGLRAWAGTQPDIRLVTVAATVEELLRTAAQPFSNGITVDFADVANDILSASPNAMTIDMVANGSSAKSGQTASMRVTGGEVATRAIVGADVATSAGANDDAKPRLTVPSASPVLERTTPGS